MSSIAPLPPQRQTAHPIDPQRKALKRVLKRALDDAGLPQKALALECGKDPALICRWLNEHEPDVPVPLDFPAITRELGFGLIEWLNIRCGYEPGAHVMDAQGLPVLTGCLSAQSGKAVQQLIQALEDGSISAEERTLLQPDLYRLRGTLDGILGHVGGPL